MAPAEKITQSVQRLPEQLQAEVLDFVEYLLAKVEREQAAQDEREWPHLSLSFAMRGMEEEDEPTYTEADLKETFQ